MAKDTFKRTAPTIEFFKDGETVRAKKLGKMVQDIQDGMASLEAAVGDIHNRALAFQDNPLFQNSIGRVVGPMDELTVLPYRQFEMIQKTKDSLHKGLIRWPHSNVTAATAGNLSSNLLPMYQQVDKTGIGCTRDDGNRCTAGYQSIYDLEKNILPNGSFEHPALSGLEVSDGTVRVLGGAQLDVAYRYNLLAYSENFENWTMVGPTTLVQRDPYPDPNGQNAAYKITPQIDENIYTAIKLTGSASAASSNWTFAVSMATSGHREVYLQISGATDVTAISGSLEGGPIEVFRDAAGAQDSYLGLDISGLEWRRYWVHASFGAPVTADTLSCNIVLGISGRVDTTPLFVFGAQLEPTNFPTEYRRTQGSATSGLGTEVSVGYSLSVVPGHTYQVTAAGSGTINLRVDGSTLFSLPGTSTGTFVATSETAVVDAYVSGIAASQAYLTLLRVDPGTPCHAMNCPGFSAYEKIRSYRAVLPAITVSGHQYFAQRLQLPDEFQEALYNELPGNVLGVFDHELNHAVPDRIVDWKLANWPIGGLDLGGLISDPEFYDDWTTLGANTYPTELLPTAGSGFTERDIVITAVVGSAYIPPDVSPSLYSTQTGQILRWSNPISPSGWPLPPATSFTAEFLFKLDPVMSGTTSTIFGQGGGSRWVYRVYLTSGKLLATQENTFYDGTINTGYSSTDLRDGDWHHYALTMQDSPRIVRQFIDGVPEGTSSAGTAWDMNTGAGFGGNVTDAINFAWDNTSTHWSGLSVAGLLMRTGLVYTGSFTASKTSLLPSGNPAGLSGIILYCPMQEGSGQRLADVGTSGNHGYRGLGAGDEGSSSEFFWNTVGNRVYTEDVEGGEAWYAMPSGTTSYDYAWDQTFTMEGWFRVGNGITSGTASRHLFKRGTIAGGNQYLNYAIGMNNGKFYSQIQTFNGGGAGISTRAGYANGAFPPESINNQISDDGLWHHVAFTVVKNSGLGFPMKLFVDGTLVSSGSTGFTVNWDWRIPPGTSDIFNLTAPSGMLTQVGDGQGIFAVDQILVTSGLKYTASFTPEMPLRYSTEAGQTPILAHMRFNEGLGVTAWNTGETYKFPMQLRNTNTKALSAGDKWEWSSDNFITVYTSEGDPTDRVIVHASGNTEKGLTHTFPLSVGTVYTLDYRVRADLTYSGIFESFVVASGTAEVDLLIDGSAYQEVSSSGLKNYYKVSSTEPGTTTWSEEAAGNFWNIHRRMRATEPGTLVIVTVGVSGNNAPQRATFDSFDVSAQSSNSTIFKYSADPVLGLNWEGSAFHIIQENLYTWSENLSFNQFDDGLMSFEFNTPDPSGNLTATIFRGEFLDKEIPDGSVIDSTVTVQFWARSNAPDSTDWLPWVSVYTSNGSDTQEYEITEEWREYAFTFTDIELTDLEDVLVEFGTQYPGQEIEFSWVVFHNGSGIVPYEKTTGQPIRRYRRAVRAEGAGSIENLDQSYGLTSTIPMLNTMTAPSFSGLIIYTDPTVQDFENFPASGVVRIQGQEFAYRGKMATGELIGCVPKWRGTNFDDSLLVSGKTVTYVPLPRAIDHIESGIVYFEDVIPAPDGDWANQMHLQIYNTKIDNLSRFSLTASAVPLTRAAGTLMTAFMHHVADDDRHFRRDQLCAALIDPSVQAGFADMEVRLEMAADPVQEVNQEAILSIFAFGFMAPNDKEITINWGDGTIDTGIFTSGQHFDPFEHTYDLGAYNYPLQHTISVEVTDLQLLVSRTNSVSIVVTPVTKGSQTVRTQIITQPTATQMARTAIFAQTSGYQISRTYIL